MAEARSIFQRLESKSTRSNAVVYNQFLAGHCFTSEQKNFIAFQISNRNPNLLEVDRTNSFESKCLVTALGISERHNIPLGTLQGWCSRAKNGLKLQPGNMGGAPLKLDQIARNNIENILVTAQREARPKEQPEVHNLFLTAAIDSKKRRRLENSVADYDEP